LKLEPGTYRFRIAVNYKHPANAGVGEGNLAVPRLYVTTGLSEIVTVVVE
jgi:hypothetical protein